MGKINCIYCTDNIKHPSERLEEGHVRWAAIVRQVSLVAGLTMVCITHKVTLSQRGAGHWAWGSAGTEKFARKGRASQGWARIRTKWHPNLRKKKGRRRRWKYELRGPELGLFCQHFLAHPSTAALFSMLNNLLYNLWLCFICALKLHSSSQCWFSRFWNTLNYCLAETMNITYV